MLIDRHPNNIGWGKEGRRPAFFPEWLHWCDPNRPDGVVAHEWNQMMQDGIGMTQPRAYVYVRVCVRLLLCVHVHLDVCVLLCLCDLV